jgi:rhamnosyltransferase
MDVSIIIRTKNEEEFIDATLRRVNEQEFRGSYEIIIVDSDSTDSTLDIVKRYNVKLVQISQEEFTYGGSLNIGASNADGTFIVNLSAHALPNGGEWLTNVITGFEDPNVAGVYGRQLSIGHLNPFEARRNESFFGHERITFNAENKRIVKHVHFSNSNCAIRKEVWQRFKFNDQVPYAEDILWQRDVMRAGFSIVYAPDALVYHTHKVNIYNAYRNSKACAYTLALMDQKRRSIFMLMYDVGVFLSLAPNSILQNIRYVWRNNYGEHLKIAPFYVMSECFGWLVGRIGYRLKK